MHAPTPVQHPVRVFICDDARDLRDLVRLTLEAEADIRVVGEAADGRAGINGIAASQPDVVVLDLAMPGIDGLEVLRALRIAALDTRVIVFSAFANPSTKKAAIRLGAAKYVEKGEPLSVLSQAIRETARR